MSASAGTQSQVRTIEIKFLSDWILSSGLGEGTRADRVLARDEDGLPFLPGRSLKGILREAARELAEARPHLQSSLSLLFGGDPALQTAHAGTLRVGRGLLLDPLRAELLKLDLIRREAFVRDLTIVRSQTAIDPESCSAKSGSLRSTECGIPGLEFGATLECPSDASWFDDYLLSLCAMVRVMGSGRFRGFGRCELTLHPATARSGSIAVPGPATETTR